MIECPSCALESDGEEPKCPYCGYEFPVQKKNLNWIVLLYALLLLWPVLKVIEYLF
jgi:hypothetical protein